MLVIPVPTAFSSLPTPVVFSLQAGPAGGRTAGATTAKKKKVVIDIKRNLYFEHGGPVPDPEIRTPPASRSKVGTGVPGGPGRRVTTGLSIVDRCD